MIEHNPWKTVNTSKIETLAKSIVTELKQLLMSHNSLKTLLKCVGKKRNKKYPNFSLQIYLWAKQIQWKFIIDSVIVMDIICIYLYYIYVMYICIIIPNHIFYVFSVVGAETFFGNTTLLYNETENFCLHMNKSVHLWR